MPAQVTNYTCPNCGGPLHWNGELQKLKCDFCDSVFTNEEIEEMFAEKNDAAAAQGSETAEDIQISMQWSEDEATHMRAFTCPSCGAQLIGDENTAATSCPYCGNPTIVPAQFSGSLKPDYVIPFRLNKEEATAKLQEFYKGKPFLPSAFTNRNHIEEIKGIYVPFWLYDGRAGVNAAYHATRSISHIEGDYEVTDTDHFQVVRQGTVHFAKIPADAATNMPDDFMDALEPFDYNDLVPFEMSYLPGYLADKYDVSAEDDRKRASVRMRSSSLEEIAATVEGYHTVNPERENVNLHHEDVHYAFFPVWMLTTRYNDKTYMFACNGQTGKMVGDDLPSDMRKFVLYFILITVVMMAFFAFLLLR